MKKIALVTGTSTGLGKSIAIKLAQKGFKVFATMRNLDKQASLQKEAKDAGISLEVKRLDVQDMSSIELCIAEIIQQEGHVDILINNAGAGFVRTTEQATENEIQWIMDVNFMGVVRCTKAIIPHMRQAKSGHIINISSIGGLVGQPFNEIYCAAKFAVEGYTESMASYIQPFFNINFTVVEPGGIHSEFANSALQQFQSTGGMMDDEYQPILEKYIKGTQNRSKEVYQTSDQVAEVVIECIQTPEPPVRIRTSVWTEDFCSLKTQADPTGKLLQERVITALL